MGLNVDVVETATALTLTLFCITQCEHFSCQHFGRWFRIIEMNMYRGPQSRGKSKKERVFVGYLFLFCALENECGCFFHYYFLGSDARRVSKSFSGIFNFNENIYRHTRPINGARELLYIVNWKLKGQVKWCAHDCIILFNGTWE